MTGLDLGLVQFMLVQFSLVWYWLRGLSRYVSINLMSEMLVPVASRMESGFYLFLSGTFTWRALGRGTKCVNDFHLDCCPLPTTSGDGDGGGWLVDDR